MLRLTGKLIAAGLGLLAAALIASLAAMAPTNIRGVATSRTIAIPGSPVQITVASLLGGLKEGVSSVNITLYNLGPSNVTVLYLAKSREGYTATRLTLNPTHNVTLACRSLLDTLILEPESGESRVTVTAMAVIVERRLVALGVLGLALFIAGTVLVGVGVTLRLSGLEAD